jgi:hypothetical protein
VVAVDNGGVPASHAFYRTVGQRKASGQGEGGNGGGTSMAPVTGDRNGEGETMGCGHFQRGREGGGETTPWCWRQTTQCRGGRRWRLASGGRR